MMDSFVIRSCKTEQVIVFQNVYFYGTWHSHLTAKKEEKKRGRETMEKEEKVNDCKLQANSL